MVAQKGNRAEWVAGQILSIARREGWQPGTRLIEQRLAEALDVSRGPVRAGLNLLANSGLAAGIPNRGFVLTRSATSKPVATAIASSQGEERLIRAIADDRLDGGLPQVVSEAELMRRYDVARPELLRLLDRIAADGWVERMPGYGWRFADTLSSLAAHPQLARFRGSIEPAAILEPAFELAPAAIDRLRAQQNRMLDGGLDTLSQAEIFQIGCSFHEEITRASGNPFYVEALRRVNSVRRLYAYRTYADREGIARHIRQHLRLLDLLQAGKRAEAAKLMRHHLKHSLPAAVA